MNDRDIAAKRKGSNTAVKRFALWQLAKTLTILDRAGLPFHFEREENAGI